MKRYVQFSPVVLGAIVGGPYKKDRASEHAAEHAPERVGA